MSASAVCFYHRVFIITLSIGGLLKEACNVTVRGSLWTLPWKIGLYSPKVLFYRDFISGKNNGGYSKQDVGQCALSREGREGRAAVQAAVCCTPCAVSHCCSAFCWGSMWLRRVAATAGRSSVVFSWVIKRKSCLWPLELMFSFCFHFYSRDAIFCAQRGINRAAEFWTNKDPFVFC